MPSDLDQLAQQQMTHSPEPPNPAQPYLDWLSNAARRTFVDPLKDAGFLPGGQNWGRPAVTGMMNFQQSGLTGINPSIRQYMPGVANTLGDLVQSRSAHDAFSTANTGGMPFIEAFWSPRELEILRRMYGTKDFNPSLLPGRTPSVIRQKAFQLGLKRPEVPPYVRQPGAPIMADDKEKFDQLIGMMSKRNMTVPQMAERLGVSERTLRRYINEDLNARMRAKAIWNDPKRIEQYKDLMAKGFLPQQMARRLNLPERTVYDQLQMLSRAGHINYIPEGGTRTPSMPKFSFQDEVSRGDPEYERSLLEYLRSRQ